MTVVCYTSCRSAPSPSVCSYTKPACPRHSSVMSSNEFKASPPQANVKRSIFLRFARRSAKMPSRASASSANGSIPFWFKITKFFPDPSGQTLEATPQLQHVCCASNAARSAHLSLQGENLSQLIVCEGALGVYQLLPLIGIRVVEPRADLAVIAACV